MPSETQDTPIPELKDPFETIELWLNEATKTEPNDPNAMALSTVDKNNCPNVRMVLLKGVDQSDSPTRGLVFYTNTQSAKGAELASNQNAALLFHWKSLRRQIRIRGATAPVSADEADAYFASRPLGARIGAWASIQSSELENRATLEARVEKYAHEFQCETVPRPAHWSGYRLIPMEIEFWHDGEFRLHHRLLYSRKDSSDEWRTVRLYP